MSDQSFEQAVGKKLRALDDVFVYHPPDDPKTRIWKPGDFIVGAGPHWCVIECKEVKDTNYPLSKWSPQQRAMARSVIAAGGIYWLVVRFEPAGTVCAYRVLRSLDGDGALTPESTGSLKSWDASAICLNTRGRAFEVEPLI